MQNTRLPYPHKHCCHSITLLPHFRLTCVEFTYYRPILDEENYAPETKLLKNKNKKKKGIHNNSEMLQCYCGET